MNALRLCLIGLLTVPNCAAVAQVKNAPKAPPALTETRYFTSIDGMMDGNADVVLKETRQGKNVTSAVFDVCFPADKGSERKDRFVVNLTASGQTLSGTTQSIANKLPVTVKLTRKPTGDTFEFRGQISIGQTTTDIVSSDNADLSEKEFQEIQSNDDGIAISPKDFSEVSPESVAVKVSVEAASDFLKALKGQSVEISPTSLNVSCAALRAGALIVYLTIDPARAAAFVANAKSMPGVVSAGWSSGVIEMDRTIRFAAAEWRSDGRLDRDKIAAAVAEVMAKIFDARLASSKWSDESGKLNLAFKRPSQAFPSLDLTEMLEITAVVSPDRPGGTEHLMLWASGPTTTTVDESQGARLIFGEASPGDEEDDQRGDTGTLDALAKRFKAQRWDADKLNWK